MSDADTKPNSQDLEDGDLVSHDGYKDNDFETGLAFILFTARVKNSNRSWQQNIYKHWRWEILVDNNHGRKAEKAYQRDDAMSGCNAHLKCVPDIYQTSTIIITKARATNSKRVLEVAEKAESLKQR